MRSVRISWKTAQWLAASLEKLDEKMAGWLTVDAKRARDEFRAAMAPKKFVKAAAGRRAAKKQTKKAATSAVWSAVMERADGRCECCARTFTDFNVGTMDHFFGKKHVKESVSNCWALGWTCCHRDKTDNRPSRRDWQAYFLRHAQKHGYAKEAREVQREWAAEDYLKTAESLSLSQQSEGRT